MPDSTIGQFLVILLSVIAALGLIGLTVICFVMWKYKVPVSGVFAMFGALIYLLSPVDVLPEALLGPFGLLDDAGVVGGTVFFVYKLIKARQMLAERGVEFPRRRPPNQPPVRPTFPYGPTDQPPTDPPPRPPPLPRERPDR